MANEHDTVKYPKGLIIYQEGSAGDDMYYLVEGQVGAFRGNAQIGAYGPGNIFGETALFLGHPRQARVEALTDITLVAVNRQNIYSIFASQPEIAYRIMEQMCLHIDSLQRAAQVQAPPPTRSFTPQQTAAPQQPATRPAASGAVQQPAARPKPVTPAPTPAPAPAAPQKPAARPELKLAINSPSILRKASWKSALFPDCHGTDYTLPMPTEADGIYEDPCECPMCRAKFKSLKVIVTKLKQEGTDPDLRVRYKDVDPMYYDIVSCPECLYSAAADQFDDASPRLAARVAEQLEPFQKDILIKTGKERDSFTVIAGYYLAIQCAVICLDNHEIIMARHWQKLSRIYQDAGDEAMYLLTCRNSLKDFRWAYDRYDYSPKQMQQMQFVIGDLYQKLDDFDNAREFFYQAKITPDGNSMIKRNADIRLEDIKELLKG